MNLAALPNAVGSVIATPRRGPLIGSLDNVNAARKAAAAHGASGTDPVRPAPPSASPIPPTNAALIDISGNAGSECSNEAPSDQALAIGDGQNPILQVNQDCLSVWSPSGTRLLGPKTLQAFAGLPANAYVFDPRALYDSHSHRFIIAYGDSDLANNSYYDIAVSQSDDPTGSWYVYRLPVPTQANVFNDFLRMGQDRQGIYLASNLFQMNGSCCGTFLFEEWIFVPKAQLYAGAALSYWHQSGMTAYGQYTDSTQPANISSPYENPRAEFLVGSFNINFNGGNCVNGCSGLLVWAVSNPFGWQQGGPTPEVSGVCCASTTEYYLPPNASQPGSPNSINTLDTRITGAVNYGAGAFLYTALTTKDSSSNAWSDVLIYQVLPLLGNEDSRCTGAFLNSCPRITAAYTWNETRLNYGGNFAFYPTAQPNPEGDVNTVFNFSGPGNYCGICYLSVGYITQRATQVPGTVYDWGRLLIAGNGLYNQAAWGRYTATAPAGSGYAANGSVATPGMGFAGSYAKADGSWGSQIGYVTYTSPTQN